MDSIVEPVGVYLPAKEGSVNMGALDDFAARLSGRLRAVQAERTAAQAAVVTRRWILLPLALLAAAPTGCASGRGSSGGAWMAGMMGAMVVGGLIVGYGWMHGGREVMHGSPRSDIERFAPARLLEQRALLELSDEQTAALEALHHDVAEGRRAPEDAARAAYELLRPVQRAAVTGRTRDTRVHH